MPTRKLYIAAYDIADPTRLRQGLHILRDYATGGQKSVFECFLTDAEKQQLIRRMENLIINGEDRFVLVRLSRRHSPRAAGIGRIPEDPRYYYLG